jgi:hypothetical protein
MVILDLAVWIVHHLGTNQQGKTYLLEGTYSLDKALNTNAWLSVTKVVEEFE